MFDEPLCAVRLLTASTATAAAAPAPDADSGKAAALAPLSEKIQKRADLFLEVLQKHPNYRQEQVAKTASDLYFQKHGGERPKWDAHTVQNDFRRVKST
jgi:hypothetical protein